MFSPHKCDQESGYSAFNMAITAFSQIFWTFPTFLSNQQDTSFSLELLGRFLQPLGCKFEVCQSCPRGFSSSDAPPRASHLWGPTLDLYYVMAISSDGLLFSDGPMAQHINLGLYPHNIYNIICYIYRLQINKKKMLCQLKVCNMFYFLIHT